MQPPIPLGTILQNRYRLVSILGQGGFGRTYLGEDLGRFQERCALKELIPAENSAYALEKARELFQREATTLYQIQHPQVPQFRATFEQDGRLFLIQDYVEGKTYRTLLQERRAINHTFSEIEVLQFIQQLLPVLAHIHSKGIIHRDISPENIILRESDRLPVLIDFGVVKELATRFQSTTATAATTVGKAGYAPSEQMQTGRAYPSSDLYSLAVTGVVLLTAKEPMELFDDTTMVWQWRRWANVSEAFAQVLQKMLSYRPSDRFQSAEEVQQALRSIISTLPLLTKQSPNLQPQPQSQPQPQPQYHQSPTQNLSQAETVAVGRRPEPVNTNPNRPDPVIPQPSTSSIWEQPAVMIAVGTTLALLAGFGSWALVTTVLGSRDAEVPTQPTPLFTPTTTPTVVETPTPTPTPTQEVVTYNQPIDLLPGTSFSKQGNLKGNTTLNYTFSGEQGQRLDASLRGEGVLMSVLAPDQNPISDEATRVLGWRGTLPVSGSYTIQLKPVKGLSDSNYRLTVNLDNLAPPIPTPTPTFNPVPIPTPTPTLNPVPTPTLNPTPTVNPVPTPTPTATAIPTPTPTPTATATPTPSGSLEPSPTPTEDVQ